MPTVLNVPVQHPLNLVPDTIKERIIAAQSDAIETEFPSAKELCARAFSDLKIALSPPEDSAEISAAALGDRTSAELVALYSAILDAGRVPEQAISLQAANLAHRTQLLRAFHAPDRVIAETCEKVIEVVQGFPKDVEDIRCGRNPGDVLDPYILGAAQVPDVRWGF